MHGHTGASKVAHMAEMARSRTMKPPADKMDVISAEAQTGLWGTVDSPENRDGDGECAGKMGEIRRWMGGRRVRVPEKKK